MLEKNKYSFNEFVDLFKEGNFYDWFRGFCDAESNFLIRVRKGSEDNIKGFEFIFRIALHIDDLQVLKEIQNKLKCRKIIKDRNTFVYHVSSLKDIETIIIPLFIKWPLMTTKYLDFLDFKESFILFKKRQIDKQNKDEYNIEILKLKNNINDKRVNFLISENNINITINYLLGLIEGDGSFYFNKTDNTVRISLIMIKNNRIVLEKIKEFLLKNLDENSLFLVKHTKLIYINNKAIITNRKEMTSLEISQLDYICNKLLPVFDKLNFRTKKYLDYLAFKRIAFLLLDGKHLSVKGKIIIDKFADTMNNSRLSTKLKDNLTNFSELEINMELLEKADPLIQNYPDGRALSLVNKNWIKKPIILEVILPDKQKIYFPTGVSCAKYFSVSSTTITARLNDKKPLINKEKNILALGLKRVKVFLNLTLK